MIFLKTLFFFTLMFLLLACSATPKGDIVTIAPPVMEEKSAELIELELVEPIGAAGKTSWAEYKAAMQAFEKDPLSALRYLDLALNEVLSEKQLDSIGAPDDSVYFATMPMRIIFTLESLYPRLANFDTELTHSIYNDYEIELLEEVPLDITERPLLGNFLDSMDLSKFSLPIEVNDRVMHELRFLTTNARSFIEASLSRKTLLDSMIYTRIKARNMPTDLIYLALVESGFKPKAYSKAKAAGVWQFIPSTGKRYGLTQDFWLDMRYNPEAATDAAMSYLSALHREFNDWYLAMAAYNCGEGRVRRLLREARAENPDKEITYWDLQLPRETMIYVPRIIAATIIGHYPERYSIEVRKQNFIPFDTVTITDGVPLDKISSAIGASVNTVRELNPELISWSTPPNAKKYTMKIPKGSREKFLVAYEKMDKTQVARTQQYKVQQGDNLGSIARKFGSRVADIQSANNLKNTNLRIGQTLIIPTPTGAAAPVRAAATTSTAATTKPAEAQKTNNENAPSSDNVRTHVVDKGDNLGAIARRYGVSIQSLMTWNELENNKIQIGQRLYIQSPSSKSTPTRAVEPPKNTSTAQNTKGTSYEIKPGDNLWDIARAHNVTVQQLKDWNPGLEKRIFPGMMIKVGE
ncbi:MAG: LysM peptidoglycan-binding domain-containing protein [Fibromonadaceae bacterium]|nr:LysM peptidoglycan-binding domain-containing protein [Fibromonadaceae bacterium]